jgi:hypothetical protein
MFKRYVLCSQIGKCQFGRALNQRSSGECPECRVYIHPEEREPEAKGQAGRVAGRERTRPGTGSPTTQRAAYKLDRNGRASCQDRDAPAREQKAEGHTRKPGIILLLELFKSKS